MFAAIILSVLITANIAASVWLIISKKTAAVPPRSDSTGVSAADLVPDRMSVVSGDLRIPLDEGSEDYEYLLLSNNARFYNCGVSEIGADEALSDGAIPRLVYEFDKSVTVIFPGGVPPYEEEVRVFADRIEFYCDAGAPQTIAAYDGGAVRFFSGNDSLGIAVRVKDVIENSK